MLASAVSGDELRNPVVGQMSDDVVTVSSDRITATGAEQPHLTNGGFATDYRRGTFDDSSVACPEPAMSAGRSACLLVPARFGTHRPYGFPR